MKTFLTAALCGSLLSAVTTQPPAGYQLVKKTLVGGEGGWDYLKADPEMGRVFVFNNEGPRATVLDAASGEVVGTLPLGGAPEAAVTDNHGTLFVNLEDKNEIVAFDARALKVRHRWPLTGGDAPTGLAFDVAHYRLFSVCHTKLMLVLDSRNGKILAKLPIGGGVDGAVFDEASQSAISSNGEGTMTVVREEKPGRFAVVQTVPTERGARTITLDPQSHHVFLTTARYGPPAGTNARPPVLPGTFTVLEYGRE